MIRKSKFKWRDKPIVQKAKQSAKGVLQIILRIVIMIASILLILGFFRWAGLKGMLAFMLGMGIMAYLLLSKNMMFMGIIETFGATEYIREMRKKDDKKTGRVR